MSTIQITDAGVALMQAASAPLVLTSFKLGSGVNYTPTTGQTGLQGSILYTGTPAAPVVNNANVVLYSAVLSESLGPISFGEVGFYYGSTLFAVLVLDILADKEPLDTQAGTGGALIIDTFMPMVGSNYQMWANISQANTNKASVVAGPEALPHSVNAAPNLYIVQAVNGAKPFLAYTDRQGLWNFDSWNPSADSTVSSSTTTAIKIPVGDWTSVVYQGADSVIIQFSTGGNAAVCRYVINAVADGQGHMVLSLNAPMAKLPVSGDSVRIYQPYSASSGTPSGATFTTLVVTESVSGAGIDDLFSVPDPIGSVTPNSGAFTTLHTSGALTAAGVVNLTDGLQINGGHGTIGQVPTSDGSGGLAWATPAAAFNPAAPGAIGATTPSTGKFTTLNLTTSLQFSGQSGGANQVPVANGSGGVAWAAVPGIPDLASPGAIGATVPATGAFTGLTLTDDLALSVHGQVGSAGQALTSQGPGHAPAWTTISAGGQVLPWVFVTGHTDTEIGAAVAAVNALATGAVLYFPGGAVYTSVGGKVLTKPCIVLGDGPADSAGTKALSQINCTSATAHMFDFQADPWGVKNIFINNTAGSAPTAGTGIHTTLGNGHRLRDVVVQGFYNNIDVENGAEWYWNGVFSYGFVNWGAIVRNVALPGSGNQAISDSEFISHTYNSQAGLRYESGGGLKIVNTRFSNRGANSAVNGIDVELAAGAALSNFMLSNVSIENTLGAPLKMRDGGSGATLFNVTLNGVQVANYPAGFHGIDIVASTTGVFDRLILNNLQFRPGSSTVSAINLQNIDNVAVGLCVFADHPKLLSLTAVTNWRNVNHDSGTVSAPDDGTHINIDGTNNLNYHCIMAGDRQLANPTNVPSGKTITIRLYTGGHTLTYGSAFKFPKISGVATPPTLDASDFNVLSFHYDSFDGTYALVGVGGFA